MGSILIKGGRVIDPANNIDSVLDILVIDNKISKVEKNIDFESDEVIDAKDFWVVPGLIDLHVHLREPGFEHKETIKTGSQSAAMGGFTSICPMPNTIPVTDSAEVIKFILSKSKENNLVNILPVGAITKNMAGEELSDFEEMKNAGMVALSEDGKTVDNAFLMKEALKEAKRLNINILSHCEDSNLTNSGSMNEGKVAESFGEKGVPNDSENIIIARDILLAETIDTKLHICHVSTKEGVQLIREAKKREAKITGEAAPHHFTLVDEDIVKLDANYKMAPPLRSKSDLEAILKGLKDGTLEVIATDHAPHHVDEKSKDFASAPNGIVGLETAIPLCITELVEKKILTPAELISKLTINPAKIIGIDKGTLSVGKISDITIINPNEEYIIDTNLFCSKSKNSPFNGKKVRGRVLYTIVAGKVLVRNGKLI